MRQPDGHTVSSAERLDSARRMLGGAAPDVLSLDSMLPDGSGLELLEELRESPVKRVVFITGHSGSKSLIENLSGPSVSYLRDRSAARSCRARSRRKRRRRRAARATAALLFLDELAELPIELQPHVLRVLETGSVLPVGSEREVPVDARTIETNGHAALAIGRSIREVERELIMRTLEHSNGEARRGRDARHQPEHALRPPERLRSGRPRGAVLELLNGTPRAAIVFVRACC